MRARVRRAAACGPHGTTRPHDLPTRAGNAGTRAWSPPPRRSTPAARRTSRCGDPPEMQWSACKTTRPGSHFTDRPPAPASTTCPGPEPEEASRRHRGSSIVDGEPRCCIPRPAHAWCGPSDAHEPCDHSDPPGTSDPLHDRTGDGGPSSRRPHAPSTLAPSRCPSRRWTAPGRAARTPGGRDPVTIAASGNRGDVRACRHHRMPYRCNIHNSFFYCSTV